jgi:hypothetical protein
MEALEAKREGAVRCSLDPSGRVYVFTSVMDKAVVAPDSSNGLGLARSAWLVVGRDWDRLIALGRGGRGGRCSDGVSVVDTEDSLSLFRLEGSGEPISLFQ